ncbi:uracil-DNA glycosylase [Cellulophaga sp. HaHaR_3_176]|uniref:uracil-DNA glycosylase n=1 Tax=Cellulophaga sp. HaHaR_3_176 TaxID=1942464 RepID=UPI001C1F378D|nr:uracil-DNA glycosylase [Cellulophaga sp. HaHaR_3_176]QWX85129.1 uracil-DNA glycosylase [Cellulophaga sp. HaHaR_3_176]
MKLDIHDSWATHLNEEFKKPYFINLMNFVDNEYREHTCYPEKDAIFSAFNHSTFDGTKIVIIGQDPYHGINQANGLCFSVKDGITHPPSLKNIFKELESDIQMAYPNSGNLESWAKQGILLLNATLTVRSSEAGSHQKQGWEIFTDAVIKLISSKKENVIFLLWGGFAKKKIKIIDQKKHHILESGHPSPLSANRGFWFGNAHFSTTNEILKKLKEPTVVWDL